MRLKKFCNRAEPVLAALANYQGIRMRQRERWCGTRGGKLFAEQSDPRVRLHVQTLGPGRPLLHVFE